MKLTHKLLAGNLLIVALAASTSARAAEGWTRYSTQPSTNYCVRMDGTSSIHAWEVEGRNIGGYIETGPGFPVDAAAAKPGKVEAKVEAYIPVRSLKSFENGKPYSNAMDKIMYEKLLEETNKQIKYSLTEMTLKEAPKAGGAFQFETKGNLAVAGVTNSITMPVEMSVDGNKLKFVAKVTLKMTDFKVEPPAPALAGGLIKTGDEVKLTINWTTAKKP